MPCLCATVGRGQGLKTYELEMISSMANTILIFVFLKVCGQPNGRYSLLQSSVCLPRELIHAEVCIAYHPQGPTDQELK